ncbi:MAG: DUF115 domain-containing protein [Candidatus Electrothrix sp. EH2]|nr:DUF115 domain-containing protein [Candidatus Electrothrix sp. EH2]
MAKMTRVTRDNLIKSCLLFPVPYGIVVSWRAIMGLLQRKSKPEKNVEKEFHSNLRQYHHTHKGKECFIIGAGPSVKSQKIENLAGRKCISVSNVYVHPMIKAIQPVYHVLPNIFKSHKGLYEDRKFIEWLEDMDGVLPSLTKIVMHIGDKEYIDKFEIFKKRDVLWYGHKKWDEGPITELIPEIFPSVWSVSETALALAIYIGFSPIYLLGMDHDWFNGLFNYFFDHRKEHILAPDEKKIDFVDSEFQMRRHAFIFRKYKELYSLHGNIFNCNSNKNSYVDVFPKIELDNVLF